MSDKIYNHLTGRFIQRYGPAHKKLLKQGLTQENNSNMKKKVKPTEKVIRKIEVSSEEEQEEEEEEVVVKQKVKKVKPLVKKVKPDKSKKINKKFKKYLMV